MFFLPVLVTGIICRDEMGTLKEKDFRVKKKNPEEKGNEKKRKELREKRREIILLIFSLPSFIRK